MAIPTDPLHFPTVMSTLCWHQQHSQVWEEGPLTSACFCQGSLKPTFLLFPYIHGFAITGFRDYYDRSCRVLYLLYQHPLEIQALRSSLNHLLKLIQSHSHPCSYPEPQGPSSAKISTFSLNLASP